MNKALLVVGFIIILLGAGGYLLVSQKNPSSPASPAKQITQNESSMNFSNPKRSAHHEGNTPSHGAVLVGVPVNIVIDFNFDLAPPSSISIKRDSKEYGIDSTVIDSNKLSMRRNMDPSSSDGTYTTVYKACWSDGSCHEGNFQFKIDRKKTEGIIDMSAQNEITVKLSQIAFNPQRIKISKGTQVTWINDDSVEHFVNTDSHPSHSYFPSQNSKALKKGDKFSLTFDTPGIYPYHCSAHTQMKGSILVE